MWAVVWRLRSMLTIGPGAAVFEHALGAVAERNDQQSFGTGRDACGQAVHLGVIHCLLRDVAAYPRVHDARAVDAEQDAQTGL